MDASLPEGVTDEYRPVQIPVQLLDEVTGSGLCLYDVIRRGLDSVRLVACKYPCISCGRDAGRGRIMCGVCITRLG